LRELKSLVSEEMSVLSLRERVFKRLHEDSSEKTITKEAYNPNTSAAQRHAFQNSQGKEIPVPPPSSENAESAREDVTRKTS